MDRFVCFVKNLLVPWLRGEGLGSDWAATFIKKKKKMTQWPLAKGPLPDLYVLYKLIDSTS